LIDEINRAKTARVFGELLYLLEYRDRKVELQNGTTFSIPLNLYIIGTMNTTDKSIALVDYALRRRFAFIDLAPVKNGSSVVLRKWLDANQISNAAEIDSLFVTLNEAIAQKDEALMVGHSYFMQKEAVSAKRFSDDLLKFLWDYYILPLIAEYEYQLSRSELEERYGLDALRSAARAKAATA
jgi:5-methylcytosine-specific restriction protein B